MFSGYQAVTTSVAVLMTVLALPTHAEDAKQSDAAENPPLGRLTSYEPNLLGYAHDSNDVNYMDFKVSLKYPLFHNDVPEAPIADYFPHLYMAFTGRFSQYISTRDSSPVIAKRFNPELIGRYWLSSDSGEVKGYVDLIYGHESNGQSIGTYSEYLEKRNGFVTAGENPDFADDYISRGWDYIGTNWKFTHMNPFVSDATFTGYLGLRYFLEDGQLQGKQEEYNSWENNPEGKRRKSVDGISLKIKHETNFLDNDILKSNKIFLGMTTGYDDIFENNTYRLELSVGIVNVPFIFWAAKGYNSDLADYYKDVTSYGIGLEFVSN